MKQYPSIDGHVVDQPIYAFDKLDGSNIRAEWQKKHGFVKFGSRHVLIDEKSDSILVKSIGLFKEIYEQPLSDLFKKERLEQVTCFFEFHGPNSFAGVHDPLDAFTVTLFDLDVYKRGLLPPNEFLKLMSKVNVPKANLLYQGKANQDFVNSVKSSTLPYMTFEGVVCKGSPLKRGYPPLMFKVKSLAWIQKVKSLYTDEKILAELL